MKFDLRHPNATEITITYDEQILWTPKGLCFLIERGGVLGSKISLRH